MLQIRGSQKKSITFSKQFFLQKFVFVDRSIAVLWKKLLENCRQKNKTFTTKPRKNFSLHPKLMKISMESSEKSCFLKRFLWTTRKQCQRPCQKFFSQIQNFRSKSAKDKKSIECISRYFFLSSSTTLPKVFMPKIRKLSTWSPENMKKLRKLINKYSNNSTGHEKCSFTITAVILAAKLQKLMDQKSKMMKEEISHKKVLFPQNFPLDT